MDTPQHQSQQGLPRRRRGRLSLAGVGLLVLLSACVFDPVVETPVAPPVQENADASEEVPTQELEQLIEVVRDIPESCDVEVMTELGWFELKKNENFDPARFLDWLSRPDSSEPNSPSLRCVYGGESYHDILAVEYQQISAAAAAGHREQLFSQSYRETVMSTPEAPMLFRSQVSVDGGPAVLPSELPGFREDQCWEISCITEVVIYGQGMWVVVAWATEVWEGDTERNTLRVLQKLVSEG